MQSALRINRSLTREMGSLGVAGGRWALLGLCCATRCAQRGETEKMGGKWGDGEDVSACSTKSLRTAWFIANGILTLCVAGEMKGGRRRRNTEKWTRIIVDRYIHIYILSPSYIY